MDPVSLSSGIAGLISLTLQVSGVIAEYVNAVKEGPKTINELKQELLLLGEILSQLQDFLRSEKLKGRPFESNSVLQSAIFSCKARIERIGDKLKPSDGGKVARVVDRMKWPFEQKEIAQMITNMRSYTQLFSFSLQIENCNILAKNTEEASKGLYVMLDTSRKIHELSLQMGGLTSSLEESAKKSVQLQQIIDALPLLSFTAGEMTEISQGIRYAELRDQERRKTEILDWLAPISALQKHVDVEAKRTPGTGAWFLETKQVLDWIMGESEYRDLLCVGGPGVGKTVLTSSVIAQLKSVHKGRDVCVVHYYFEYSEHQGQTAVNFARSLLRQLCSQCNSIPSSVVDFYRSTRNDIKDAAWYSELQGVINRVASTFGTCFLVLDAFDETDVKRQRNDVLELLKALRQHSSWHIFASTRPHLHNIEQLFGGAARVEVSATDGDLRLFLSGMIDMHPDSEYLMDEPLKKQILTNLCENAHGMFLLPVLQIRNILDQVTKSDVRRALSSVSADIREVFRSTIDRIKGLSEPRRDLALKTMMWISHSKRALTVDELRHALAVRPEDEELDRDNLLSLKTILDSCCGLVEVDAASSKLRFVHFTLEEYLRSDHGLFQSGHLEITKTCLQYMTLESLKAIPDMNRNDFENALLELPFLDYAALNWGLHAQNVAVKDFKDEALRFFESTHHLLAVARIRLREMPDFRKWKERMIAWAYSGGAGISLAASFGLTDLIKLVIGDSQHPKLMARNVWGSTPLHEAAILGYESTAKLLIDHGADLLVSNKGKNTPFYLAVAYGQISMARFLLQYGHEQVNINCRGGWTPLHNAADLGNEEMVTLLLQAGATLEVHNDRHMMPLHLAARKGHLQVVKLLVLAGAALDVKGIEGLSPLDFAATSGHVEVVDFLLRNGASLDLQGDDGWVAIHRAVRGGHNRTASLLIQRGADLLKPDNKGQIPLHHAARSGSLETVRLLLNVPPDVKRSQLLAKDKRGSPAGSVAFFTAHYDVHKHIRGAELEILGPDAVPLPNSLTQAIEDGNAAKVRLIVKSVSKDEINTLDEITEQQPLHIALQEENEEIAKILLEHGADINGVGYHGWQPLHIAASVGNLALVKLCLLHGANVHARTSTLQTPLHKACSSQSVAVVRELLAAGGDPEAMNERGMRALHIAVHQNRLDTVELLVQEQGVDFTARDRLHDTPAKWAERSGHLGLLRYLKEEEGRRRMKRSEPDVDMLEVEDGGVGEGEGAGEALGPVSVHGKEQGYGFVEVRESGEPATGWID